MKLFSIAKQGSIAAALAAVALLNVTSAAYAADVGVSISVGQPGFYGQIDIGDFPQPQLVYGRPIAIERRDDYGPPIYLRVPPGHVKNWKNHCREYNACDRRVYFVQDSWYQREYVPRYQQRHQSREHERYDDRGDGRNEHGDGRGDQHRGEHDNDRRDDNRDEHGNGRGR